MRFDPCIVSVVSVIVLLVQFVGDPVQSIVCSVLFYAEQACGLTERKAVKFERTTINAVLQKLLHWTQVNVKKS